MKAILVVDIPKEFENEKEFFVKGSLYCGIENVYTKYCYICNIDKTKLKPLPQSINPYMKENSDYLDRQYINGWNDCLDEIIGGEKND